MMTDTDQKASRDNEALERYRIRFGLYKVILGTMIVGLAGVLIPGAIEYWKLQFEEDRKRLELRYAQEMQQRDYVRDFLDTALSQDIELRIRFAHYFQSLLQEDESQAKAWRTYYEELNKIREDGRGNIKEYSQELEELLRGKNRELKTELRILELRREIDWIYAELGYVQPDRSVLPTQGEREREERLLGVASPAQASEGIVGQIVVSGDAGKGVVKACLQKKLNNFDNGNPIHIWDCGGGPARNKTWIYEPDSGLIRSAAERSTCLHKRENGWRNGNPIHLWKCDLGPAENKTWFYDVDTKQIRSRTNPSFCIHKQYSGTNNGNPVHLWRCGTQPNNNEMWDVTLPVGRE